MHPDEVAPNGGALICPPGRDERARRLSWYGLDRRSSQDVRSEQDIEEAGYKYLWPDQPFELGRTFEMNDRRAVIVGVCKASPTFQTFPIVYTRYSQAIQFVPRERKVLSFVLAQPAEGEDAWQDASYLESLITRGRSVTIGDGDKVSLNLRLNAR